MRRILFVVAVLGLLVSGYLYVEYSTGGIIPCSISGGCNAVRDSQYSHFLGLPVPAFGLVFYVLLAVGSLFLEGENRQKVTRLLQLLTGAGLVVSAYLTYLEAMVIHAWCQWCILSAILTVVAFGLVWGRLKKTF